MEFILAIIVLIANIYVILQIFTSTATTTAKVVWVLVILLLPVIGLIAWLVAGPRGANSRV